MYGIFGENRSDYATLSNIVRRLTEQPRLSIPGRGYEGAGDMLNKCWKDIKDLAAQGTQRFIVCHDADRKPTETVRDLVEARIIRKAGLRGRYHIAVPVQAIEAWILADVESLSRMFTSWTPGAIGNPETYPDPKYHLEALSRIAGRNEKRYEHRKHNPLTIAHRH